MADHIPFVNTRRDCEILKKYYKNSHTIRVSLESISNIKSSLPQNIPLWIDAAIDGCEHHLKNKNKHYTQKEDNAHNKKAIPKDDKEHLPQFYHSQ